MSKASPNNHEEAIRHLVNNKPEEDFCGLTLNEMRRLIYEPYTPESPLKINPAIPDQVLDQLPFSRLTEEFLKLILRDGFIKLTPLGALPKKVLVELYGHRLILEDGVEHGIHKLHKEMDSTALTTVHINTALAGLVRKANGKLLFTREATKLLADGNRNTLFSKTLVAYTEKLFWGHLDGYPDLPVGNLGWGFTIFMLLREGAEPREEQYYGSRYLKAFPEFLRTYPNREFSVPERDLIRCYSLRTFDRCLEWWGFVTVDGQKIILDEKKRKVTATKALGEVFRFDE
jgi:hypothetical protein